MLAGRLYDPADPELVAERTRARRLMRQLNTGADDGESGLPDPVAALLPMAGSGLQLEPPFFCDYGYNIRTGSRVFVNFNCVVLDAMPVVLGDDVMIGPAVQIYTATHPLDCASRKAGREFALPVRIGDDCWIGGGAIICPGVTVGAGTVIGAGSVVTRDVPENCLAAGNPCHVKRTNLHGS